MLRQSMQSLTPKQDDKAHDHSLGLVTKFLLALTAASVSEVQMRARGGAYMQALDDIPPWALAEAIRRWHRGEAGVEAPGWPIPSMLRSVCVDVLNGAEGRIEVLDRVLVASKMPKKTDQERETMVGRFKSLIASVGRA